MVGRVDGKIVAASSLETAWTVRRPLDPDMLHLLDTFGKAYSKRIIK